MKQFAIIGAGPFGRSVLRDLILTDSEIILIDKDSEIVESFKNDVAAAYIANVINEEIIKNYVPPDIDAAVVDLGESIDVSILAAQYLKKIGVQKIIAKADSPNHGEILSIVGVSHVVYPNSEAARRIMPMLMTNDLFRYLSISGNLIMAESAVPDKLAGKSAEQAKVRRVWNINIVASRRAEEEDFSFLDSASVLNGDEKILIVGTKEKINAFLDKSGPAGNDAGSGSVARLFRQFFSR